MIYGINRLISKKSCSGCKFVARGLPPSDFLKAIDTWIPLFFDGFFGVLWIQKKKDIFVAFLQESCIVSVKKVGSGCVVLPGALQNCV